MKKICEISYDRRKTAEWLLKLLKSNIYMNHSFFVCLQWVIGDLHGILKKIAETAKVSLKKDDDPDAKDAMKTVNAALKWSKPRLVRDFDDIVDDYPCLMGIAKKCIERACRDITSSPSNDSRRYSRIRDSFRKIFGSSRESAILCEFVCFVQTNSVLENYFEDSMEVFKVSSQDTFARMLGISLSALQESIQYLTSFGLIEMGSNCFRLKGGATSLWNGASFHDISKLFCAPLTGQTLPLDSFRIPVETVQHLEKLLAKKDDGYREPTPVHIMLYGHPGTGKTALAKHIARELGRECFVKRASDLLSPYVGEAEKNVAEAFRRAEGAKAVLVIDEADTFLYSRDMAQHSWENSLVNEFLTALEECKGFCICTTNRMEIMDAAAMRRFSFKVGFTYAGAEQVSALYAALLTPLADGDLPSALELELRGMTRLTPGDFHAVRSQHWLTERGEVSHEELVRCLKREQDMKLDKEKPRIGFMLN